MKKEETETLYGLLAQFPDTESLVRAVKEVRKKGYNRFEAYSPFPVEELHEPLNFHKSRLPMLVFIGGLLGGLGGFFMQYFASVIHYPYNVGGRPFNSWPSFIPITFELTILGAALSAVFGMLLLNGLPMPYHPLFNVKEFKAATRDGFFLCLQARDPKFDAAQCRKVLEALNPMNVIEVTP